MQILKKQFKKHSKQRISDIKKLQHKYKKELIQPRIEGELNEAFLKEYGAKHIRISQHDIKKMERKNPRFAEKLASDFRKQNEQNYKAV